jgi:hypothetical protein
MDLLKDLFSSFVIENSRVLLCGKLESLGKFESLAKLSEWSRSFSDLLIES